MIFGEKVISSLEENGVRDMMDLEVCSILLKSMEDKYGMSYVDMQSDFQHIGVLDFKMTVTVLDNVTFDIIRMGDDVRLRMFENLRRFHVYIDHEMTDDVILSRPVCDEYTATKIEDFIWANVRDKSIAYKDNSLIYDHPYGFYGSFKDGVEAYIDDLDEDDRCSQIIVDDILKMYERKKERHWL